MWVIIRLFGRCGVGPRRHSLAPMPDPRRTPRRRTPGRTVHLTPSEIRVLALLPTYRTLAAIGDELGIARPTVKTHVGHIYEKLGAVNRAEAVRLAESAGILPILVGHVR
jgi:DNA-binding CsgD family transcriptional regulator